MADAVREAIRNELDRQQRESARHTVGAHFGDWFPDGKMAFRGVIDVDALAATAALAAEKASLRDAISAGGVGSGAPIFAATDEYPEERWFFPRKRPPLGRAAPED